MKKKYKILIGIVLLLIAIRIILPYVVLHYANDTLANMKGYYGHIDDIDLAIFRGAYIVNDVYLNKSDTVSAIQTDFFKAKKIEFSLDWGAIFNGRIVGELEFDSPVLIFTRDKVELSDVNKDTTYFQNLLKDFMPLKVNRFEVFNGDLHYVDNTTKPNVDVALKQLHVLALNLSNVTDNQIALPSTVFAVASVYEGTLTCDLKLNALNDQPTFDLNAEMKNTNLPLLNDIFQAYGHFDVNKGTFGLYTEMAAKNGKFKGYVKPIIKDLDVFGPQDRGDTFFNKMYEQLVGTAGVVFKNQWKDQVATKVNIEGDYKNPKAKIIDAIWEVLRNAYIQALIPKIDYEISLKSVDSEKQNDKKKRIRRILKPDKTKNKKK